MTLRSVASVALLVVLSACSSPQPYMGANYNQVTPKLLTVSQILVDDVTTVQPAPSIESKLAPAIACAVTSDREASTVNRRRGSP